MKLFLDTANLADIETALQKGFIKGITTNPSLMAKEPKGNYIDHMKKIVELINQYHSNDISLSVEVFAQDKENIIIQAEELVGEIQYENLSIKVPIGWEELEAIYKLSVEGISVNCTCIFCEAQ